jgi:hypothetical protein
VQTCHLRASVMGSFSEFSVYVYWEYKVATGPCVWYLQENEEALVMSVMLEYGVLGSQTGTLKKARRADAEEVCASREPAVHLLVPPVYVHGCCVDDTGAYDPCSLPQADDEESEAVRAHVYKMMGRLDSIGESDTVSASVVGCARA